jgi:hypothetical protein
LSRFSGDIIEFSEVSECFIPIVIFLHDQAKTAQEQGYCDELLCDLTLAE